MLQHIRFVPDRSQRRQASPSAPQDLEALHIQAVVLAHPDGLHADALGDGDRADVARLDDRDAALESQSLEAVSDGAQGGFRGVPVALVGAGQVPADFDLVVAVR